jgi:hypothetical protein
MSVKTITRVYRNYALPIATFDYLKQFQREYELRYQAHLSNSQALTLILEQHKQCKGAV